ncbi:MAG: mechanosensitive ion channel domain-containing protein [Sulfurimonas sp.]|jgi:small conductance mechanosensitive channel
MEKHINEVVKYTDDVSKYTDIAIMYTSEYGLKIIAAILIFMVGKWAITKISHFTKVLMERAHIDQTLVEFAHSIVYFVLLIMVVLASLNTLGINTSSFLAIFGAASLAVGLAIKDSLSNIGAAVIIIIFRPFKIGDTIETGGANGTVKEINLFSTIIEPADKSTIIIPNSSIIGKNITNFSNRKERRIDLIFSISYDSNLKLAKDTLMDIITSDARVLTEPSPLVAVNELAPRSVNLAFKVWVNTENYGTVYFDMLEKVKLAFDEKGISIPVIDGHTN